MNDPKIYVEVISSDGESLVYGLDIEITKKEF